MTFPTTEKIPTPKERIDALTLLGMSDTPGKRYTYHIGMLITEREKDEDIKTLGDLAMKMSDEGWVQLYQRRLGNDRYEYVAVRTSKPIVPASFTTKSGPKIKLVA